MIKKPGIRKNNNVSICKTEEIMLTNDIIQKLENLETGYYLRSDTYLENTLLDKRYLAEEMLTSV